MTWNPGGRDVHGSYPSSGSYQDPGFSRAGKMLKHGGVLRERLSAILAILAILAISRRNPRKKAGREECSSKC
jgi:hypothetical protein